MFIWRRHRTTPIYYLGDETQSGVVISSEEGLSMRLDDHRYLKGGREIKVKVASLDSEVVDEGPVVRQKEWLEDIDEEDGDVAVSHFGSSGR